MHEKAPRPGHFRLPKPWDRFILFSLMRLRQEGIEMLDAGTSKRWIWKQEESSVAHGHRTPLHIRKRNPSFSNCCAFRQLCRNSWPSHLFSHIERAKMDQMFSIYNSNKSKKNVFEGSFSCTQCQLALQHAAIYSLATHSYFWSFWMQIFPDKEKD